MFKVDKGEFERTAEKGMDFAWYAYKWLLKHLHPYYHQIVKDNPNCDVYLVEDNSGSHTRARRFLTCHDLQKGILFTPQPSNSPDLHPIERIFDALKEEIRSFVPLGKKETEILRAKEQIRWIWQEAEMIGDRMDQMTDNAAFIKRAKDCLDFNGWNFFHG